MKISRRNSASSLAWLSSSTSAGMSQSAAKAYTNAAVADKAKVTISSSAPSFPNVGDIWVLPT